MDGLRAILNVRRSTLHGRQPYFHLILTNKTTVVARDAPLSPEPYYLISMNNEQLACGGGACLDAQWNVGLRPSISIENYHPRQPSTRRVEYE
jgi:hypothetical protein